MPNEFRPPNPEGLGPIAPFWGFSAFTPTIPKLYWNVKSQEQRIHNLFKLLDKLIWYADSLGVQINVSADDIAKLKEELESIKDGGLLDYYEKQIYQWIQDNMESLMQRALLQFVVPSVTNDGYFCIYRPDSWNDIMFDFGAVYGRSDYGHIILRFEGGPTAINNTYPYSLSQNRTVQQLIADLEVNAKRTDAAYDTLFTNLNQKVVHDYDS